MQIIVLNLERDTERRKSINTQLNNVNLQFEFLPAVLGKNLSRSELNRIYDGKLAFRNLCRDLTLSEIGCAISHIKAYQWMLSKEIDNLLILEDDVVIPDNLPILLKDISLSRTIPEVVLLSPAESKGVGININNNYKIFDFKGGYFTSSYIVNRLAAEALITSLFPIGNVADCWPRLARHKIINLKVIEPYLIDQDQANFGSSTTEDIKNNFNYDLLEKVKFKLQRAFWLSYDSILAIYNRNFNPYQGCSKN